MSIIYSNASFRTHVLAQNKVKIYTKKSFQNTIMPLFNTSKKLYVYNSNFKNYTIELGEHRVILRPRNKHKHVLKRDGKGWTLPNLT